MNNRPAKIRNEQLRLIDTLTGDPAAVMDWRIIPETAAAKKRFGAMQRGTFRMNYRGTFAKLEPTLRKFNAQGYAVFYGVNATDGKGRKKQNITKVRALPLDLDRAPLPDSWDIEPHIITETSRGKFQCLWIIEPTTNLDAAQAMAKRLALKYDGDPSVTDATRVLRPPGFVHQKGKPFTSRIVGDINEALPYKLKDFDKFLPPLPPRVESTAAAGVGDLATEHAIEILNALDPAEVIPSNAEFLTFGMALKTATAGCPEVAGAFYSFCARDTNPKFAGIEDDVEARFESFTVDKDGGVGIGTLKMLCQKAGLDEAIYRRAFMVAAADDFNDDDDPDAWLDAGLPVEVFQHGMKVNPKTSIAADTFKNSMAAVHRSGLTLAYNEMSRCVEFIGDDVPWDTRIFGRVLDDPLLAVVRFYIIQKYQGVDFDPAPKHLTDALYTAAYGNRYNPVADYLARVQPTWDGVARVENLFGEYFNCGDDEYTRGVSRAFGIGAVRRIRHPGSKFDTVPVLKGPQGWNKSTGVRKLFGDRYYSDTPLGRLDDKDAAMKLRGIWCYELGEMGALTKQDINALKAFLSILSDRHRDAYARLMTDVPRTNVFMGTINDDGYLNDQTGNRRIWPLDVKAAIDEHKIIAARDQIWAEAATMESAGESDVLERKLWAVAAVRQEAETVEDPWEGPLRSYLAARAASDVDEEDSDGVDTPPADKVHTSELFGHLNIETRDQSRAMTLRLRSIMVNRLRWIHKTSLRIGDVVLAGYARA